MGKRIVLGVTGSVSAYRAPDIARVLMRLGAHVHPVMTLGARKIIHENLFEWARPPNFFAPPKVPGGSVIVGVQDVGGGIIVPSVLANGGSSPKLLIADLDLRAANRLRRKRLKARRVETYAALLRNTE